ncbi:MAG: beta/gamma crystallin-related protein [Brevundimonas sp.]
MLIEMLAAVAAVSSGAPVAQDGQLGARVAPRGDYRDSCSGEYVNRGRLYADCRDDRGRVRGTSIELNRCTAYEIRNNDGLLVCGPNRGQFEDRPGGGGGGWPGPGNGGNGGNGQGIVVYRDDGFQGTSRSFDGAISDLRSSGLNDTISSMRMRGQWTACTDANFQGQCQTFSGDVSSLRAAGMNDRISSLRPGRFGGGNGGGGGWGNTSITVFVDALYRGASESFSREIPDLRSSGFNDRISSMRVRGSWEVCTDAYFQGQCDIIREDAWNLQQRRLNDSISSMRPVNR